MPARPLGCVPEWARPLVATAAGSGEDIRAALTVALEVGARLPLPGRRTAERWAVLAELARANLTVARVTEAHADALAILAEARADAEVAADDAAHSWGVFAAEAPGARLDAVAVAGGFALTGSKPWCSLGDMLDAALVTAHGPQGRQLFRVDLRTQAVRAEPAAGWVARGLRTVTSVPLRFESAPAAAVGAPGWYLERPGFASGGIGVAACWFGGAWGLADTLRRSAARHGGELSALHVGTVDAALHGAGAALDQAAADIDAGRADRALGARLALQVRAVVADAVERVLLQVGRALGPAPLAFDARHAARVADLQLYVRQHHGERDLAALGRAVLDSEEPR